MPQTSEARTPVGLRVVVVDDNHDVADSLQQLLELWGHDVRVAYDGPGALRVTADHKPDCVFLDIGLPGLDGYRVARRIRSRPELSRAKLIALSAYADETHARRAAEAGFDFRLTKPASPTDIERLLHMLQKIMDLAERTEGLAQVNVSLANETKELLQEVRQDIKEVKDEVRELKQGLRDVRDHIAEEEHPAA